VNFVTHLSIKTLAKMAGSAATVFILSACGGAGNDSGTPTEKPQSPAPTLTLSAIKSFGFTWPSVSGATYYRLMENPDGMSGFTQAGENIPSSAVGYDHIVPLFSRQDAQYQLDACNDAGCSSSATITGPAASALNSAIGYLKADNAAETDEFGYSVSVSDDGKTLAVGAPLNDVTTGSSSRGAVYVFARDGGSWSQQAYLTHQFAQNGDEFGSSISLSGDGNTLAIGAPYESSDANGIDGIEQVDPSNRANNAGAVFVYARSALTWTKEAYVKASNSTSSDRFGTSVSLSDNGDLLAVGATGRSNDAGRVFVFKRSASGWAEQHSVAASNADSDDYFGHSIALSGDGSTLAVGAIYEDSQLSGIDVDGSNNNGVEFGAVYIFTPAVGTPASWAQQAYIKGVKDGFGAPEFGQSVSLSQTGNTLAVGAWKEDNNATGINGAESGGTSNSEDSGAVYVFDRTGTTWTRTAYIKASNTFKFEYFGYAVSLSDSGTELAVSAYEEKADSTGLNGSQTRSDPFSTGVYLNNESGAVYVFTKQSDAWSQTAYIKATNTQAGDHFGFSVALSGDAGTLAVGAVGEDSNATTINGDQTNNDLIRSGAVYLY
jgi:hypothetical protein